MIWDFQYDNGIRVGAMGFGGDLLIFEEKSDGFKTATVGLNREEAIALADAIRQYYVEGNKHA